ncbi:hypothetical protein [Timonella sp. A28]|uniref:hypothetical protein n=1 Tax=Timonella sp. A28 TaxID=3442640 RepID=UPI003EB79167
MVNQDISSSVEQGVDATKNRCTVSLMHALIAVCVFLIVGILVGTYVISSGPRSNIHIDYFDADETPTRAVLSAFSAVNVRDKQYFEQRNMEYFYDVWAGPAGIIPHLPQMHAVNVTNERLSSDQLTGSVQVDFFTTVTDISMDRGSIYGWTFYLKREKADQPWRIGDWGAG